MIIRSYFGIEQNPFSQDNITLLYSQQEVYDILKVHCQQGGLCLLMGEPGTGKTVIKETLRSHADKRMVTVTVARTLHTYTNTIKILCDAFNVEVEGTHFKCERRLIDEALALYRTGKLLVIIIDDAHLMEMDTLRRIRLLLEDFPKNHNLILIGQTELLTNISFVPVLPHQGTWTLVLLSPESSLCGLPAPLHGTLHLVLFYVFVSY
jgi:MSHA biogenesis protein MshM